jgi:hypothetical protein
MSAVDEFDGPTRDYNIIHGHQNLTHIDPDEGEPQNLISAETTPIPVAEHAQEQQHEDTHSAHLTRDNDVDAINTSPSSEHLADGTDDHSLSNSAEDRADAPQLNHSAGSVSSLTHGWRPGYLRRRVLMIFLVLFCLCLATLEILYQVSQNRNGLVAADQSRRYLWTFGPTAALTIIAGYWARVEFQTKQSAPWQSMRTKPTPAPRSILLDYISPIQPVSIVKSLRYRHYAVSAAGTCSLLLKLMIAFSTSFLSLSPALVTTENIPVQILDSIVPNTLALGNIGDLSYNILNGVLFDSMSYPEGTNEQIAFQLFDSEDVANNSVIGVTVDGIFNDLDCEPADFFVDEWYLDRVYTYCTPPGPGDAFNPFPSQRSHFVSSSCEIVNMSIPEPNSAQNSSNTFFWAQFLYGNCTDATSGDPQRVIISAGEAAPGALFFQGSSCDEDTMYYAMRQNITVVRSTQMICTPILDLQKVQISLNSSSSAGSRFQVQPMSPSTTGNLPNSSTLALQIANVQRDQVNYHSVTNQFGDPITAIGNVNPFANQSVAITDELKFGLLLSNGSLTDVNQILNQDILLKTARSFYQGITAQISRQAFFVNGNSSSMGQAILVQNRLFVQPVALRGMEISMAVVIFFILFMILLLPKSFMPSQNPGTILSVAVALRHSDTFRTTLAGTGAPRRPSLQQRFRSTLCQISLHQEHKSQANQIQLIQTPEITKQTKVTSCMTSLKHQLKRSFQKSSWHSRNRSQPQGSEAKSNRSSNGDDRVREVEFWKPYPGVASKVIVFACVFGLVIALEVLLLFSNRNVGLVNVTNGPVRYVWTVIPAIITLSIGLFFSSIDFAVRVVVPFVELKRPQGSFFQRSIAANFLDATPPATMLMAFRSKQWVIVITTIATLIGSFLTIVAAGLFSAQEVPQTSSVTLQQETWFATNLSIETGAYSILTAGLIAYGDLPYPKWTYGDLAIPELSLQSQQGRISTVDQSAISTDIIETTVSALRPGLICNFRSILNTSITLGVDVNGQPGTFIEVGSMSPDCRPLVIQGPYPGNSSYFGGATPGKWWLPYELDGDGNPSFEGNQDTCSDYAWIWGQVSNDSVVHVAFLTCNGTTDEVQVRIKFNFPGFDINTDSPPVLDESSPKQINGSNIGVLDDLLLNANTSKAASLDNLFEAIIYGKDRIPLQALGNEDEDQTVSQELQSVWNLIITQSYNNDTRQTVNASTQQPSLEAILTNPNRLRLIQDDASTHTLVALLLVLLILGVASSLLVDTCNVLPENPCSIAGKASLLADSNFLKDLPEDADSMSALEIEKQGGFSKSRFALGWFDSEGARLEISKSQVGQEEAAAKYCIQILNSPSR